MKDLIIVGSGIAGLTAAIYAKRYGLELELLDKAQPGGQLLLTSDIENYPGFRGSIPELMKIIQEQLAGLGVAAENFCVEEIEKEREHFVLKSGEGAKMSRAVIWAAGLVPRPLGVKGEKEFQGRGVSYCATCDGFFFRGKEVAVVGGGDRACEEALLLSRLARKVYLIHRRDKLRAALILQEKVFSTPSIEILWNSQVEEIQGEKKVEVLMLKENFRLGFIASLTMKPSIILKSTQGKF